MWNFDEHKGSKGDSERREWRVAQLQRNLAPGIWDPEDPETMESHLGSTDE